MVGMNKKKERSQNAVSVKNPTFLCMGCADWIGQGAQIFIYQKFIFSEISTNTFTQGQL